jgi:hypothetical protein
MACPHCGSWAVKADRSLAGRMVCARCGRALGRGEDGGPKRRSPLRLRSLPLGGRQFHPWLVLLLTLLGVSAGLAWWAESPQGGPLSPPGRAPAVQQGGG